jgi:hypothetical protein
MNESCPSAKVRNVQATLPLHFSIAFHARQAFAVLMVLGLLGCNRTEQKPQKKAPHPEGGDEPVFAVAFRRLPAVSPVTTLLPHPDQPAGNAPS